MNHTIKTRLFKTRLLLLPTLLGFCTAILNAEPPTVKIERLPEVAECPARFRELLQQGEQHAVKLEQTLKLPAKEANAQQATVALETFKLLGQNCQACHREFRDPPRTSK